MAVNKIVYAVSDGKLDDLARKSIHMALETYVNEQPTVLLYSYESEIPKDDPVFLLSKKIANIRLNRSDLEEVVPNIINEKFDDGSGVIESHWDRALSNNQYLANFSDLIVFYLMAKNAEEDFLYIDSDMLCLRPLHCEKSFVVAYDKGENDSLYINASLIYVPKGFQKVKERWISYLENEILQKYRFRYGMMGPIAFDKFLNKPKELRGFELDIIPYEAINPIAFTEMYTATCKAIDKGNPVAIDIHHEGPLLNLPRSGVTTAITHKNATGAEVLLGITSSVATHFMDIQYLPKEVRGIEYYEKLKDQN